MEQQPIGFKLMRAQQEAKPAQEPQAHGSDPMHQDVHCYKGCRQWDEDEQRRLTRDRAVADRNREREQVDALADKLAPQRDIPWRNPHTLPRADVHLRRKEL